MNIEVGGEHTFDTKVFKKIEIVYTSRVEHTGEEDHKEEVEPNLKIRISEYRYWKKNWIALNFANIIQFILILGLSSIPRLSFARHPTSATTPYSWQKRTCFLAKLLQEQICTQKSKCLTTWFSIAR